MTTRFRIRLASLAVASACLFSLGSTASAFELLDSLLNHGGGGKGSACCSSGGAVQHGGKGCGCGAAQNGGKGCGCGAAQNGGKGCGCGAAQNGGKGCGCGAAQHGGKGCGCGAAQNGGKGCGAAQHGCGAKHGGKSGSKGCGCCSASTPVLDMMTDVTRRIKCNLPTINISMPSRCCCEPTKASKSSKTSTYVPSGGSAPDHTPSNQHIEAPPAPIVDTQA